MRTIAIANPKGGVGKTSVAVNLAAGLAMRKRPTLLLDLEPQNAATFHLLEETPELGLGDVLSGRRSLRDVIVKTSVLGLEIAPGGLDLAPYDRAIDGTPPRVRRLFEDIPERFAYAIIDTPPAWGGLAIGAVAAAKEILIPVETSALGLAGFGYFLSLLEQMRGGVPCIVPTRTRRTNHSREAEEALRAEHKKRVLAGIRNAVRAMEAPMRHLPVLVTAPSSGVSDDYRELVRAIIAQERGR